MLPATSDFMAKEPNAYLGPQHKVPLRDYERPPISSQTVIYAESTYLDLEKDPQQLSAIDQRTANPSGTQPELDIGVVLEDSILQSVSFSAALIGGTLSGLFPCRFTLSIDDTEGKNIFACAVLLGSTNSQDSVICSPGVKVKAGSTVKATAIISYTVAPNYSMFPLVVLQPYARKSTK